MTEKEYQIVSSNDEWIDSNNRILALIQSAQLQMLRPIIEQSKEGKDALDNHLTITKRVKKSASIEVDSELNDFQEYKSKYSHMSYDEYQKMKRETKKAKK
jgi:vacuolar-type H+-ATPase catalytic subunit A/Vma1